MERGGGEGGEFTKLPLTLRNHEELRDNLPDEGPRNDLMNDPNCILYLTPYPHYFCHFIYPKLNFLIIFSTKAGYKPGLNKYFNSLQGRW